MTTTPIDAPEGPQGPPPGHPEPGDLSRLRRSRTDRHLAGVAGGLARHLDIDPVIVRVALVVLVFFGGAGLLLYVGGWLFVPEEGTDHAVVSLDARSRTFLLYAIAGLAGLALLGDTLGHFHVPWQLFFPAVAVLAVLAVRERVWARRRRQQSAPVPDEPVVATQTAGAVPPAAVVPPAVIPPAPVPAPDPRKRGPILFWFTVALIALAEGVLGIVDLAGGSVAGPAYAALAVGVVGVMLVLGAFWGRAGGLILLGLVASLVLGVGTVVDRVGARGNLEATPTSAAAVAPTYRTGAGSITLDLTQVADRTALQGRTIHVGINLGDIRVIVPAGMGVDLRARVHGPGNVHVFGTDHGGVGVVYDHTYAGTPTITLVADLRVGELHLEEQ
jgi:phage shock protein PspC (stress-responsive transcriptional regulator)